MPNGRRENRPFPRLTHAPTKAETSPRRREVLCPGASGYQCKPSDTHAVLELPDQVANRFRSDVRSQHFNWVHSTER